MRINYQLGLQLNGARFYWFNPHWHDLWNQEKCLSLAPPRLGSVSDHGHLYRDVHGQINLICVNFHCQKRLASFEKNSSDKIWSKKDKEIKISPLMLIRIKYVSSLTWRRKNQNWSIFFNFKNNLFLSRVTLLQ